jgi:hypothetical protein
MAKPPVFAERRDRLLALLQSVTDDNTGSEWRHCFGVE